MYNVRPKQKGVEGVIIRFICTVSYTYTVAEETKPVNKVITSERVLFLKV